jgi:MOSC domain-containing protein YiiM
VSLETICRFRVPRELVHTTEEELRRAGREGYELFVLWSGVASGDTIKVITAHVPNQTSYKTKQGLLVRVEGNALHKLNVWLYEHEQILTAQVHAHPTNAFHSTTDDSFPIVTELGGLSLVAPDFARRGILCSGAAGYRLTAEGWIEIPPNRLTDVIYVVD